MITTTTVVSKTPDFDSKDPRFSIQNVDFSVHKMHPSSLLSLMSMENRGSPL
jgi:hypothetical protein